MKKNVLFIFLLFFASFSYWYVTPNELWNKLYNIINSENLTKRQAIFDFCDVMYHYKDPTNNFAWQKSVFLKILCNETGIYKKNTFASDIKLKDSVKKYYRNVWENKRVSFIWLKCSLHWFLWWKNSLNVWDFSCVAKSIFDKLENDIFNIVTFRILWGDLDQELNLEYWQKDVFWDKVCKDWLYLNYSESDTDSVCNHKTTFKYLKNNVSSLKSMIKNNLSVYDMNYTFLNDFVTNYRYWYKDLWKIFFSLRNISYDELYFYNLFLTFYKEMLKKTYGTVEVVKVWDNPSSVYGDIDYKEIAQANSYIWLSQASVNKTWDTLKELYRTYPIHIWFLAIEEDLTHFMKALSRIYTPLDQLRYKLINNQDLDRE